MKSGLCRSQERACDAYICAHFLCEMTVAPCVNVTQLDVLAQKQQTHEKLSYRLFFLRARFFAIRVRVSALDICMHIRALHKEKWPSAIENTKAFNNLLLVFLVGVLLL